MADFNPLRPFDSGEHPPPQTPPAEPWPPRDVDVDVDRVRAIDWGARASRRPRAQVRKPSRYAQVFLDRFPRAAAEWAEHCAGEWAAAVFTPEECRQWLDMGAIEDDPRTAAALRAEGISPRLARIRLVDRRTKVPTMLYEAVASGNWTASIARKQLESVGKLPRRSVA